MRGTILGYDTMLHAGAIAGFDGQRYNFVRLDWRGAELPAIGQEVDFVTRGSEAAEIYPLPVATAQAIGSVPSYSSFQLHEPGPPFSWTRFLLSFYGRIDRKTFLLRWILLSWLLEIFAWQ